MKTEELKLWIIERILKTDDEQLITEVLHLLQSYREEAEMPLANEPSVRYGLETPPLADWQRESIEQGLKDIEEGRYREHRDVINDLEKWLEG